MIEIESCDSTCNCQTITPSSIHSERWDLIRVIVGQWEEAGRPGGSSNWHDIFCVDCEASEVSTGRETLEQFADRLIELGWAVFSVDNATAICKKCSNKEDEENWARQYQSDSGGVLD